MTASEREVAERRPLLLGECPSARGDRYSGFPLSGPPARVLCQLAGIEPDRGGTTYGRWFWALRDHFDTLNLFDHHVARWSAVAARARAREIEPAVSAATRVVLLGRRVAAAFGLSGLDWGEGRDGLLLLPHPSGLNRLYNDPVMRERAGAVLREAMGAG